MTDMPKKKQDKEKEMDIYGEESFIMLPQAPIKRMIDAALPSGMKVAKATGDAINACCTVFIRTLASEANRQSAKNRKQFISAEHVNEALEVVFPEAAEEEEPPTKGQAKMGARSSKDAADAPGKKKRRKKLTKKEEAELAEEQDAMFRDLMMSTGGRGDGT